MYRFAICDDCENDLDEITYLLKMFLKEKDIHEYEIDKFLTGNALYESSYKYDLIFLDIQLTDINGINLAKKFIENKKEQNIIFISSSSAYLKEGYRVKALRYLTKPIDKNELFFDLSNVLKKIVDENRYIYDETIPSYKLYYKDIQYIEVMGRNTFICYKGEKRISKKQLKVWVEELSMYHFARSHNSFLINLEHVYDIKNSSSIILKNNVILPLSRTYKNEFRSKFYEYLGDCV